MSAGLSRAWDEGGLRPIFPGICFGDVGCFLLKLTATFPLGVFSGFAHAVTYEHVSLYRAAARISILERDIGKTIEAPRLDCASSFWRCQAWARRPLATSLSQECFFAVAGAVSP
jgi:hypothetical protein